jgi:DNA-binding transcriptional regulator YiaG
MAKKQNFRTAEGLINATELRKILDITQQEFATLLGLSTTTVSRWERDQHMPDDEKHVYLELLVRSLEKNKPQKIVASLRDNYSSTDAERMIRLVHLGD